MATGSGDLTEDRGATKSKVSELLELQSSDHPGMVLVSTPLNGRNYMAWSRAMRIALGAKMKLGFITGKCVRPDENSDDFEKWMRVDCMREIASISQEQRKKDGTGGRVFNVQTSDNRAETEAHSTSDATSVSEIVRMELMKFMRGLAPAEQQPETRSDEYAGINFTCSKLENLQIGSWIIDSGATNHMCANSSLFHSLTLLKKPVSIRLPDNSSKTVTQSGTICLNDKISLAHVLYVPFFHNNLISDRMTEEVLAVARQTNRLYILDPSSFSRNLIDMHCSKLSCKVFHVAHGDVFLWHQRLGHPSFKTLQHVKGFSSSVLTDNTICDVCPMAKQSRLPFQTSTSKSSTLFELIHIDLWGPYKHASLSGCHFFLTIVDDYSRTTWTYLLKHKSQAVPLLETYLQMVQTQFDAKVKFVRSDNGLEFLSLQCQSCSLTLA
ncbi:UNVERIFIED_CONTAM: Retrovirus-related Pol polyprotein from transposon RE2 [Sesamum radiatum]|uniref:Retrovirus-related Pol polyprotein from transposon RE2 n=1 Tax=Sesamum radiatum TaxID=300843 RepID=A0AAW2S7H9_SESRA